MKPIDVVKRERDTALRELVLLAKSLEDREDIIAHLWGFAREHANWTIRDRVQKILAEREKRLQTKPVAQSANS